MNILPLICVIFAFVCFMLGAVGVPEPHRWRLVPAGLAFFTC